VGEEIQHERAYVHREQAEMLPQGAWFPGTMSQFDFQEGEVGMDIAEDG
jgi:hypothetical protein